MLQMPVYREISTVEPKVFFGMSWRQCASGLVMLCTGIPVYLFVWLKLGVPSGTASYVVLPFAVPLGAYGWWRPKGLKPEIYLRYVFRHWTESRTALLDGPAHMDSTPVKPSIKER